MRPNSELRQVLDDILQASTPAGYESGDSAIEGLARRALKLLPKFDRRVEFTKAFERIEEGYGRASAEVWFILHGPEGAVNLRVLTGWWLPSQRSDVGAELANMKLISAGYPAALGVHSYTNLGDDWQPHLECGALGGSECWSNCAGGFMLTERIFDTLIVEGEEAFWLAMQRVYNRTLSPAAVPA